MEAFIRDCFAVFDDLDCTLLEMNPFTLDPTSGARALGGGAACCLGLGLGWGWVWVGLGCEVLKGRKGFV